MIRKPLPALTLAALVASLLFTSPMTSQADEITSAATSGSTADSSAFYPELEQPSEMSLMIQVHQFDTEAEIAQLTSRLKDIRTHHRDPSNDGFIRNLVLTDIGENISGSPVLSTDALDAIAPYLPGGSTPAFDNAFVGTVLEPPVPPGSSPYIEGILDPEVRAKHLKDSEQIARAFLATYPDAITHWYISWEAFLPELMRDITYTPTGEVLRDEEEHAAIRAAYLDYQTSLINTLRAIAPRSVMRSPAVDQPLSQLDVDKQREAAAENLSTYFAHLEQNVGTSAIWLVIQDTLGRCFLEGNTVETTIAWHSFIAQHHTFANLAINAETFVTTPTENASCGEDWESNAVREKVRKRLLDYDAHGVRLGASFDLDRWYEATHQMPWPSP